MRTLRFIVWLFIATMVVLISGCQSGEGVQISDVWSRPSLAGGNGAVFFTLNNPTGEDDTLLSASSDIAGAIEIHRSKMVDGAMKMEKQDEVLLPAGGETIFQPGGLHVMLIGLNQDLNVGDIFTITLRMEKAGERTLDVVVKES
jgi:copper(I)-binding protein